MNRIVEGCCPRLVGTLVVRTQRVSNKYNNKLMVDKNQNVMN